MGFMDVKTVCEKSCWLMTVGKCVGGIQTEKCQETLLEFQKNIGPDMFRNNYFLLQRRLDRLSGENVESVEKK